ncbi:hypothetical protein BN2537_14253 [Streptomyces venezuelae]|nr:hypothetical protein BN2537_14253 [Streptomyces venezuelae]
MVQHCGGSLSLPVGGGTTTAARGHAEASPRGRGTAEQAVAATPGTGHEPKGMRFALVMQGCCAVPDDHCALAAQTGKHCAPLHESAHWGLLAVPGGSVRPAARARARALTPRAP